MGDINIIYTFTTAFIILWIFLLALTVYQTNRTILRKKGYKDEFIQLLRKTNFKRNVGIAVVVPVLGIFAALVMRVIFGDLRESSNLIYVYILWLLLIIPFPILEIKKGSREFRELAVKTNTDIVIDFKFKILHLVFVPGVEAFLALLYIAYFMIFMEFFHVAFIHIFILWCLYGAARFGKNMIRPGIREVYIFTFIFMALNQLLLIFHIFRETVRRFGCEDCPKGIAFTLGIALGVVLICKMLFYFSKLPKFNSRLKIA